jgi:hypothetical protein
MAALGLENVELVAGDIHELDAATLGGPFDLAFTRAFLMHQADPVRTPAAAIASLPGCSGDLLGPAARGNGAGRRTARDRGAPAAIGPRGGSGDRRADGFFATQDPAIGFEIHAGSLAAARERAIEAGIAAEMIDHVASPFLLDLVLRKPQAM